MQPSRSAKRGSLARQTKCEAVDYVLTEYRIRKAKEDVGGTAFADYVWKPVVLIEMKKRGQSLAKHYRQAFDYWIRLAPNRPKYVVLCNFDEFRVYDLDSAQIDTPLDVVSLKDLLERWGPLAFLFLPTRSPSLATITKR